MGEPGKMKPVALLDSDVVGESDRANSIKKLEDEGYLVLFVKPGSRIAFHFPPSVS